MNLDISKKWLVEMAEKEANQALSVGGLVVKLSPSLKTPYPPTPVSAGLLLWLESSNSTPTPSRDSDSTEL